MHLMRHRFRKIIALGLILSTSGGMWSARRRELVSYADCHFVLCALCLVLGAAVVYSKPLRGSRISPIEGRSKL